MDYRSSSGRQSVVVTDIAITGVPSCDQPVTVVNQGMIGNSLAALLEWIVTSRRHRIIGPMSLDRTERAFQERHARVMVEGGEAAIHFSYIMGTRAARRGLVWPDNPFQEGTHPGLHASWNGGMRAMRVPQAREERTWE